MEEKLVSIMIGHYLAAQCLKESVDEIMDKTTYKNFELIISDDGTNTEENDKVLIELKNKYPLKLVINSKHNCFSYAINEGMKLARGEYLILLSNDVRPLTEDWIDKMVKFMDEHPECGIMCPRSINQENKIYFVGTHLKGKMVGHNQYNGEGHPPTSETVTANGACMVIPTKVFQEVGGFDETFTGLGYEDVEFSYAVKDKGYKLYYFSEVTMLHLVEATTKIMNDPEYLKDNYRKFAAKWSDKFDSNNNLKP